MDGDDAARDGSERPCGHNTWCSLPRDGIQTCQRYRRSKDFRQSHPNGSTRRRDCAQGAIASGIGNRPPHAQELFGARSHAVQRSPRYVSVRPSAQLCIRLRKGRPLRIGLLTPPVPLAQGNARKARHRARENLDRELLDATRAQGFASTSRGRKGWQFIPHARTGYYLKVGCSDLIGRGQRSPRAVRELASGRQLRSFLATGWNGPERWCQALREATRRGRPVWGFARTRA